MWVTKVVALVCGSETMWSPYRQTQVPTTGAVFVITYLAEGPTFAAALAVLPELQQY